MTDVLTAGDLLLTRWRDDQTMQDRLRIDRADPCIRVADAVLEEIRRGSPFATYDPDSGALTITGSNLEVIYRITEYDPESETWLAVWPD
jgi:hypothetical protein